MSVTGHCEASLWSQEAQVGGLSPAVGGQPGQCSETPSENKHLSYSSTGTRQACLMYEP